MLQLHNHTPFVAELSLLNDEHGDERLYTIVKATFRDDGQWVLAEEQAPVWPADVYHDEPDNSSLRYPAEYHLGKAATDVLVEGDAWAFEQKACRQMPVDISVGNLAHRLQVFGDRVWLQDRISRPEPFVNMPLVYERAYGGAVARGDEAQYCDERNPVGRFAAGQCREEELDGEPLPNIEHPNELIQDRSDHPTPAGVGAVAPHWAARSRYAGTYDEYWQNCRSPFAPEDFSRRFFNSASPALVYPGWLQGGEPILVRGMHPEGDWQCTLPQVNLSVRAQVRGEYEAVEPKLETVLLQPEQRQLVLSWRAEYPCPRKTLSLQSVTVNMRR